MKHLKSFGLKQIMCGVLALGVLVCVAGCTNSETDDTRLPVATATPKPTPKLTPVPAPPDDGGEEWTWLFDGKSLAGWEVTQFGGEGDISVEDDMIVMDFGCADMTGITWQGPVLRMNYEITCLASPLEGADFFCGLTFPYEDSSCSLIVGGWGGSLIGISSFDDMDASNNETTRFINFEEGEWYRIRVRVTDNRIDVWIDDELIIESRPDGRKVSVRAEMDLSQPLGIAAWNTKSGLRDIRMRKVAPLDI